MDGYRVRFEHGRGHRMVLEGEPPIRPEELDRLQLRMLTPSAYPGLLRLETEELDGSVAFRYSLSGRRMLAAVLRSGRWTMGEAVATLCRLAEILEQGREYMLDVERYALDDEWIFVGEEGHDLALVYVPVQGRQPPVSVAAAVEKLIVRWVMNVEAPDGAALQRLLRLTASPDFSPGALLRLAREILADRAMSGDRNGPRKDAAPAEEKPLAFSVPQVDAVPAARLPSANRIRGQEPVAEPKPYSRLSLSDPHHLSGLLGAERSGEKQEKKTLANPAADHSRRRVLMLTGTVMVLALIWKFLYMPHPDRRSLLIATGLSLLTIAAAYGIWKGNVWAKANRSLFAGREGAESDKIADVPGDASGVREEALWSRSRAQAGMWPREEAAAEQEASSRRNGEEASSGGASDGDRQGTRWPSRFGEEAERPIGWGGASDEKEWSNVKGMVHSSVGAESAGSDRTGFRGWQGGGGNEEREGSRMAWSDWPAEERVGFDSVPLEPHTSWLSADGNETALLPADGSLSAKEPFLEWESDGVKRKIRLQGESIVIGRSKDAAQHVDETQGVSRAHLELVRGEGTWRAKDLGSRNGSWLNGVPMAPYESYPLQEGDSIQIASSLYRFNCG
ncbi:DUF6382 domain-containing protein [Cohnella zeiphila]|uniref:FHA domain-containing protein n=1 Tax=Cohnella zeiphila TaxID=2761120 RepID=A0A7X0VUG0_9BACL|nr:DUF6382 domain-containing protein [Cohnella zeiphila]MBB6730974.1 FHA domain-containing protein [Cohnella zeiphila]